MTRRALIVGLCASVVALSMPRRRLLRVRATRRQLFDLDSGREISIDEHIAALAAGGLECDSCGRVATNLWIRHERYADEGARCWRYRRVGLRRHTCDAHWVAA